MRIGLVPISAKPYHSGHDALVNMASRNNDAVFIYVSLSDRIRKGEYPIKGWQMEKVWMEELLKIMPDNVEVIFGGSPVRNIYEYIDDANQESSEDIITIYSDVRDTRNNYSMSARIRYMGEMYQNNQIRFAAEENPEGLERGIGTPDISGTEMRTYLERKNKTAFVENLPGGINKENVWNILSQESKKEEEVNLPPLPPSSF
tara:strand:- start:159 stop:767 length:609 start_codon:yes stop_codon:yes gene_type:complete